MTAEARHARFYRTHARPWLVALALGCLWVNAHAVNKNNINRIAQASNGKAVTLSAPTNSGGSTIPVSPAIGGWTQAGNYGVPPGATGATVGHVINGEAVVGGSAKKYPFQATYTMSKADWAAVALGAAASVGCVLATGGLAAIACATLPTALPFLYDWITRSGGRVNPQTGALERQDTTVCTVAPCYYWAEGHTTPTLYEGQEAACAGYAAWYMRSFPGRTAEWHAGSTVTSCVGWNKLANGTIDLQGNQNVGISRTSTTYAPKSSTWYPSSMDDILPYMKNVVPDNRVWGEALEKGVDFTMPTPTVTGPTVIQGPETTTTNPDGSRTVARTSYNFQTSGNTITNTSNVTNTTTYNTDNSVRSTSSTTTTPTPEDTDKDDACEKRPNSLGCSEADTPTGEIPRETKTITYTEESVFGGGSCPSDKQWSSGTLHGSYKLIDWTTFCGYALPARALVILLAIFAAFLIVMPGKEVRT